MQANICTHLTTTESRAKIWPAKYMYASSAGDSAVLSFFVAASIVIKALVFSTVFVVYISSCLFFLLRTEGADCFANSIVTFMCMSLFI